MRHIIPISGKDSLATAIWQQAREPGLPYEFVFNDTRAELPETYIWLNKVERVQGITITRIGKSLADVIAEQKILPSPRVRFCTKYAKIFPMNKFIGVGEANVYFGLRADEPDRVGAIGSKKMNPIYPLREAGIGLATVYHMVQKKDLLPPNFFWQRLYDEVQGLIGDRILFADQWPRWMKDRLFAWRSRPNCFFCFFQRRYEWAGLLDNHPELFEQAEQIEGSVGSGPNMRRTEGFTWIAEDMPLARIRERKDEIIAKRAEAVARLIEASRQTDIFQDTIDSMDEIATSCGLLCGK